MAYAHFRRNSQNDSLGIGAGNVTYFPGQTLPLFNLNGAGISPARQWQIAQPPQLWYNKTTRLIGMPGILNAQFVGQPLLDYRKINGG